MRLAFIGVGSNLGSRDSHVDAAAVLLNAADGVRLTGRSRLYETAPVGPPQPDYLNGAFRVRTALTPQQLLEVLHGIELERGRDRSRTQRWGPRTLDLDILWFEGVALSEPALTIPHISLADRKFALLPMLEVAPELRAEYQPSVNAFGDLGSWRAWNPGVRRQS